MKYELMKLDLSGEGASIYTVYLEDENTTLFDRFIQENIGEYKEEIEDIVLRVKAIGRWGARSQWFKMGEGIGKSGQHVCALYDHPNKNLRLYCIREGTPLVILGGGGVKSKKIRELQQDPKLTKENYLLRVISDAIFERVRSGEIKYINDYMDLEGNLKFVNNEEYES